MGFLVPMPPPSNKGESALNLAKSQAVQKNVI